MTGEGWSYMQYVYWNAYSPTFVTVYFNALIGFLVFFVLNLFLAVISDSFEKINKKERIDEEN